jgi:hypothetical protein
LPACAAFIFDAYRILSFILAAAGAPLLSGGGSVSGEGGEKLLAAGYGDLAVDG